MVQILGALSRLESKIDILAVGSGASTPARSQSAHSGSQTSSLTRSAPEQNQYVGKAFADLRKSVQHVTLPQKIIIWPSIYLHLMASGIQAISDLQSVFENGTAWYIRQEMMKHPHPLPSDVGLPQFALSASAVEKGLSCNVFYANLTAQQVQQQCEAYFGTFNLLFPILDEDQFMKDTLAPLMNEGYGAGDPGAVVALLVLALGQTAIEGVFDRPISTFRGRPSGFRGGSAERPPALAIFNEARKRLGFVIQTTRLESVQIKLLEAAYYEAHARHLEFWRCSVAASMSCQILVRCNIFDWDSPTGDLVKRAYWTCMLNEDLYHIDLDLPTTGLASLEDEVPLPSFQDLSAEQIPSDSLNEDRSRFQYYFLAMITLRRLIARINLAIHECKFPFC